ncbi:MAG: alpha-amylase [Chitinophagaceae bacterium]|nr:MAG: alpha-amylase [Chitinophagaceae bacterium]
MITNKHMNIFPVLLWILLSCSKTNSPGTTNPPVDPPPADPQYGTPFNAVPDPADAAIYQVNTRAFSASGDFRGVQARLDSIRALGINVLYLMPVYPVGTVKSVNSPYCIRDYNSVAAEFGTLTDLRNLVDAAHTKGMAVILDWVANHTAWDHPWTSKKTWYKQDVNGNLVPPAGTGWNDVVALNFLNQDMRKEMISSMKKWVFEANIDGFRFDAADFVPADFWKQALDSLKKISTHKLLLFAEGTRADHFISGFQLKYGMGFYYTMKERVYATSGSVKAIDSVNNAEYQNSTSANRVVRYISNHDVNLSDGTVSEVYSSNAGALSAFVVSGCLQSVPMIYAGQEIGYPVRLNYFNNSTPISWTPNPALTESYKKIIGFRNSSNALKNGTLQSFSDDDVSVFTKTAASEKVLVIASLRNTAKTYSVPESLRGEWKNTADGTSITTGASVTLDPFQYYILLKN